MFRLINNWFHRYFSDPQAVMVAVIITLGFGIVLTMGGMLAPVLASLVIAYLLEGVTRVMENYGVRRWFSVSVVFILFIFSLIFLMFVLMPLLSRQTAELLHELPGMATQGQALLLQLPERYPELVSETQIRGILQTITKGITDFGQSVLSYSLASIPVLIALLVYLILVPVMVFFFLKDKDVLLAWFTGFLPHDRPLANQIWKEMDKQMGNYVRGKFYEIIIVGAATYIAFAIMGLNYAPLLAALVGLSVIVPYLGAAVVTVPVIVVAYFQWGLTPEFAWLTAVYFIIQGIDGNVLVPLLFSEAVNLHPIAIIVAVLVFGGLWGFWGVFFAIPLATLVKALIASWPRPEQTPAYRTETSVILDSGETSK